MAVYPLHKHKEFTNACAEMLNKQWPRSMGARLHSLSKSCDTLPVALALVNHKDVIGFSKLSTVQGKQNSCLLESVLVRESDRGKGYGRILMDNTEKYAQSLGIKTIYLNTIDKESLYAHLGYIKCKPVLSLGDNAHRVPAFMLQHFMADLTLEGELETQSQDNSVNKNNSVSCSPPALSTTNSNSESAGRPHISQSPSSQKPTSKSSPGHQSLESTDSTPYDTPSLPTLSAGPPLPPPPAPPPAPCILTSSSNEHNSKSVSISRLGPQSVIWMKKDIIC